MDASNPKPALAAADLNNDDLEDVVLFDGDSIGVMINTGASSMISAQAWAVHAAAYDLGDMDLDGLADIIVIRANADIVLYLNQGNGLFGPPLLMAGTPLSTGTSDIALADMDGDGDLDAVSSSTYGSAAWLENTLDFPVGSPEIVPHRFLQVRPNPANASFAVEATEPVLRVDVLDMRGRALYSESANRTAIVNMDRGRLPTGVYLIRATCISGAIQNARLVIE